MLVGVILGILGGPILLGAPGEVSSIPIADRIAIEDAVSQYAHRWDAKDADGFASLFTEDVVIERWTLGKLRSRLEGRDALLAYARESFAERLADRQTRHHMSGLVFIELTADAALTENVVLITHQTASDATPRIVSSGIYRNTWRRTDPGWKIAKRVLVVDRVVNQQAQE